MFGGVIILLRGLRPGADRPCRPLASSRAGSRSCWGAGAPPPAKENWPQPPQNTLVPPSLRCQPSQGSRLRNYYHLQKRLRGRFGHVYSCVGVDTRHGLLLSLLVQEAIRTQLWRRKSHFDYGDIRHEVIAASTGGSRRSDFVYSGGKARRPTSGVSVTILRS